MTKFENIESIISSLEKTISFLYNHNYHNFIHNSVSYKNYIALGLTENDFEKVNTADREYPSYYETEWRILVKKPKTIIEAYKANKHYNELERYLK